MSILDDLIDLKPNQLKDVNVNVTFDLSHNLRGNVDGHLDEFDDVNCEFST